MAGATDGLYRRTKQAKGCLVPDQRWAVFWLPARIPGNTHRTLSALVVALDQGGFFRRVEAEVVVDTIEPASSFAPQNRGAIKVLIFRESIFLDPVLSPQPLCTTAKWLSADQNDQQKGNLPLRSDGCRLRRPVD